MTDTNDDFEQKKRRSFLQTLFKAARVANEDTIERLRQVTGADWARPAHTRVFPHVPFEGIRLTELAEKLGVTKQAVQVLVDELTEAGMLERVPDPADGRAKLIRWTDRGRDELSAGVGFLIELEQELAELVGRDELAAAHDVLLAIVDHYDEP